MRVRDYKERERRRRERESEDERETKGEKDMCERERVKSMSERGKK